MEVTDKGKRQVEVSIEHALMVCDSLWRQESDMQVHLESLEAEA